MKQVNWGILGTGKIATKFAEDLRSVENARLIAVGSRSEASATDFARRFDLDLAYTSYEDLVKNPEVDIVYIGTPHNLHKENSLLCLNHGKAVLCEKPIGVNSEQLAEMLQLAREKNLFLMEALWTYFLPTISKAKQWINDGAIGSIQHIKADFGFKAPYDPEKRLFNPELAGGALLDVGLYPIAFALLFAQSEISLIQASSAKSTTGVDLTDTYQLSFKNEIIADLSCSLGHSFQNDGFIYGSEGYIKLPLFWQSTEALLKRYDSDEIQVFKDSRTTNGYNFEAQDATDCILQGINESSIMPHSKSITLLQTLDKIRKLIDLKYPFEV